MGLTVYLPFFGREGLFTARAGHVVPPDSDAILLSAVRAHARFVAVSATRGVPAHLIATSLPRVAAETFKHFLSMSVPRAERSKVSGFSPLTKKVLYSNRTFVILSATRLFVNNISFELLDTFEGRFVRANIR